jgi:hypothetical protein
MQLFEFDVLHDGRPVGTGNRCQRGHMLGTRAGSAGKPIQVHLHSVQERHAAAVLVPIGKYTRYTINLHAS